MNQYFKGLFSIVILPLAVLLSGCNSEGAFSKSTEKIEAIDLVASPDIEKIDLVKSPDLEPIDLEAPVELTSIVITASPLLTRGADKLITLAAGHEQPFEAVGHYSDKSSRLLTDLSVNDWHSSNQNTGYFEAPGVLVGGNTPDTVDVYASRNGITSDKIKVEVTGPVIDRITITPPFVSGAKGQRLLLEASATYSNKTESDITDSVSWSPAQSDIVKVIVIEETQDKYLTGIGAGDTYLTAEATDNISGKTITSNKMYINVTEATINKLTITPPFVSGAKGQKLKLEAIATYTDSTESDVTDSVNWEPATSGIVEVTPDKYLTGIGAGDTTLTAKTTDDISGDQIVSNKMYINVTEATINKLTVTPPFVSGAKGQKQKLKAIAEYTDSTYSDVTSSVTWIPANTDIATVTSDNFLTGAGVGRTTLIATIEDSVTSNKITSNTVDINVTGALIQKITIDPSPVKVAKGQKQYLTATAAYTDGTESDITNDVTWIPANTDIATVTSDNFLTGVKAGSTTLTAAIIDSVSGKTITSDPVSIEVTKAVIKGITVEPSAINVVRGMTQQLTATATYTDDTESDVTSSVSWIPVDTDIATVSSTGELTGVEIGQTTLTAILKYIIPSEPIIGKNTINGSITSKKVTINVNVTEAAITGITVVPSSVSVAKGKLIS